MDYKKAVKQAKKELEKEAIEQIKGYIKDTLEAIEVVKSKMRSNQDELKVLKADLADLEMGRFKNIKKRQEKDNLAKEVSKVDLERLGKKCPQIKPLLDFNIGSIDGGHVGYCTTTTSYTDAISDTIQYNTSNGNQKCFYIGSRNR